MLWSQPMRWRRGRNPLPESMTPSPPPAPQCAPARAQAKAPAWTVFSGGCSSGACDALERRTGGLVADDRVAVARRTCGRRSGGGWAAVGRGTGGCMGGGGRAAVVRPAVRRYLAPAGRPAAGRPAAGRPAGLLAGAMEIAGDTSGRLMAAIGGRAAAKPPHTSTSAAVAAHPMFECPALAEGSRESHVRLRKTKRNELQTCCCCACGCRHPIAEQTLAYRRAFADPLRGRFMADALGQPRQHRASVGAHGPIRLGHRWRCLVALHAWRAEASLAKALANLLCRCNAAVEEFRNSPIKCRLSAPTD